MSAVPLAQASDRQTIIRCDNDSEFTAKTVRDWVSRVDVKTLFIEPGSPWENGYNKSFNGKLPDDLLNVEIFDTLLEVKVLIERRRSHYNTAHQFAGVPASRTRGDCDMGAGLRGYAPPPCLSRIKRSHGDWCHSWGQVKLGGVFGAGGS